MMKKQIGRGGIIREFWKRIYGSIGSALGRLLSTGASRGGTVRQCMGANMTGGNVGCTDKLYLCKSGIGT
jgi:hypothetical protein